MKKIFNYISLLCTCLFTLMVFWGIYQKWQGAFVSLRSDMSTIDINSKGIIANTINNEVYIWKNGSFFTKLKVQKGDVNSIAFSNNSELIASCSLTDGTVRIWSLNEKKLVKEFLDYQVHSVAFDSSDKYLVSESYASGIRIWDWRQSRLVKTVNMTVKSDWRSKISISKNNELIYFDDKCNLKIFDLNTFTQKNISDFNCGTAQISLDGKFAAIKSRAHPIYIVNVSKGIIESKIDSVHDVYALAPIKFSMRGNWLINCINGGRVEVWDWRKNALIKTFGQSNNSGIKDFVVSADNEIITTGHDGTIKTWDLTSGQLKSEMGNSISKKNIIRIFPLLIIVFLLLGFWGLGYHKENKYSSLLILTILSVWTLGTVTLLYFLGSHIRNAAIIMWTFIAASLVAAISIYHTSLAFITLPFGLFFGYYELRYNNKNKNTFAAIFMNLFLTGYVCYWAFLRN